MRIGDYFPSTYIKADELDGDVTYTIKAVKPENVGQGKNAERKPIVYFEEIEKGLVLNKTNGHTIETQHGPETDDWIGKRITLYATEVEFQGEVMLGIRVRLRTPQGTRQPLREPAGNGNGAAPARTPAVDAAKRAAWEAFKRTMPEEPNEIVANDWKTAVTNYLPHKEPLLWTVQEWQDFAVDNFLPRKAQSPISKTPSFSPEEIPF